MNVAASETFISTIVDRIVIATPEEVARRGHLVGTALRSALREGKVLYERS